MTYYRDVSPKEVIGFSIRSPNAGGRLVTGRSGHDELPRQMPVGERKAQFSREVAKFDAAFSAS
jgi:hypothetical protein